MGTQPTIKHILTKKKFTALQQGKLLKKNAFNGIFIDLHTVQNQLNIRFGTTSTCRKDIKTFKGHNEINSNRFLRRRLLKIITIYNFVHIKKYTFLINNHD